MNLLNLNAILTTWLTLVPPGVEMRRNLGNFIISYVENERMPTMVVFNGICWSDYVKVTLMRELSKANIRSASSAPTRTSHQDTTVLLLTDLDCPGTEQVFENATRQNLHKLPFRWLALTSSPINPESPLWNQFLVNSDLVVAEAEGEGYKMTEIHKPAALGPVIRSPRGVYDGSLTDVRPSRELFRRRRDLMGVPLTMSNTIQDSNRTVYHLLREDRLALHQDFLAKNGWVLGKMGFLMLNATPNAVFSYRFGYLQNGQWTGLVQDLIDHKADIGTNIGMTKQRLEVITYLDPMDNSIIRFIFRQPALSYTTNIYSLPFSSGVWVATTVTAIIAALLFYLASRCTGNVQADVTLGDALLMTMSAVSQQGYELHPRNISARIILFVIFTSLMALYAAYGAYVMVLLQAPSSSITNLQALSESKLTLAALDLDYNHFLFKGDTDPVRRAIARRIDPDDGPKSFYNLTEGVARLRKGLFVFHGVVESVYREVEKTFLETEKCDLVEIDYIGYKGLYTPAYKDSPYLELLRVVYKQIREVGIKAAVNFRLGVHKPFCKESVAMFGSVGVMELRPVLLFMVYGVATSIAVAVAEVLVFKLYESF